MSITESKPQKNFESKRETPNLKDELKAIETAPSVDDFEMPWLLGSKYQNMTKEDYIKSFSEMEKTIKKAENMKIDKEDQDWKNILTSESTEYGGSHKKEWLIKSFKERLKKAKKRLEKLKQQAQE